MAAHPGNWEKCDVGEKPLLRDRFLSINESLSWREKAPEYYLSNISNLLIGHHGRRYLDCSQGGSWLPQQP